MTDISKDPNVKAWQDKQDKAAAREFKKLREEVDTLRFILANQTVKDADLDEPTNPIFPHL